MRLRIIFTGNPVRSETELGRDSAEYMYIIPGLINAVRVTTRDSLARWARTACKHSSISRARLLAQQGAWTFNLIYRESGAFTLSGMVRPTRTCNRYDGAGKQSPRRSPIPSSDSCLSRIASRRSTFGGTFESRMANCAMKLSRRTQSCSGSRRATNARIAIRATLLRRLPSSRDRCRSLTRMSSGMVSGSQRSLRVDMIFALSRS